MTIGKLTMDLPPSCDMWGWKWYQVTSFNCFQFWQRISLPLCGSLPGGYYYHTPSLEKPLRYCHSQWKLSKTVSNSVSYSFNSWCIDWWIACKDLFSFPRYNTSKSVLLNIFKCAWKPVFLESSLTSQLWKQSLILKTYNWLAINATSHFWLCLLKPDWILNYCNRIIKYNS